jgi:hypothetical protein
MAEQGRVSFEVARLELLAQSLPPDLYSPFS